MEFGLRSFALGIATLLVSSSLFGMTVIPIPDGVQPKALAADRAGNLWYDAEHDVVRRGQDDTYTHVPIGCAASQIAADGDGNVFVLCSGLLQRIAPDLSRSVIASLDGCGAFPPFRCPMATSLDGDVLIGVRDPAHPAVLVMRSDRIRVIDVPRELTDAAAIAGAEDGTIWISGLSSNATARISGTQTETLHGAARWAVAGPDGSAWFDWGRWAEDGTVIPEPKPGDAAIRDPEGPVWTIDAFRSVQRISANGNREEFLLPGFRPAPRDVDPIAIAAGTLWVADGSNLIAIARDEPPPDISLRGGDFLSVDEIPDCCFEGDHPMVRIYRFPAFEPMRELDNRDPDGPLATGRHGEWYWSRPWDGNGEIWRRDSSGRTLSVWRFPPQSQSSAFPDLVLPLPDRGAFVGWSIPSRNVSRIVRFTSHGAIVEDVEIASRISPGVADLASDDCTILFSADQQSVSRVNVCDGSAPETFLVTGDLISAIRALDGGEVLVATRSFVSRYAGDGSLVRTYDVSPLGELATRRVLALAIDGRSFWTGSGKIQRFDIETGELLESVQLAAPRTWSLFVIDEPRPGLHLHGSRRRGVRH